MNIATLLIITEELKLTGWDWQVAKATGAVSPTTICFSAQVMGGDVQILLDFGSGDAKVFIARQNKTYRVAGRSEIDLGKTKGALKIIADIMLPLVIDEVKKLRKFSEYVNA